VTTETLTVENLIIEVLSYATMDKIKELKEENYHHPDMMVFIAEHGEDAFISYYEEYVNMGESHSYDAVDAFVSNYGVENVASFEDAYQGEYSTFSEFAHSYFDDMISYRIPDDLHCYFDMEYLEKELEYDYTLVNGYVFNDNF